MALRTDDDAAKAALDWQIELGATEAIGDTPVNRYEAPKATPEAAPAATRAKTDTAAPVAPPASVDPVQAAKEAAAAAASLDALKETIAGFEFCDLKRGARHLVFADGNPEAPVMIIGEAPGREEDREGRPFVGRAGQLLDRMFAAIGLSRDNPDPAHAIYITNVVPWRPPHNREPTAEEIAVMRPFLARHVELAGPDILVLMGNTACQALLGKKGITRLHGHWEQALGRPVLPMFHPAYLLRNPAAKREAWQDLLTLKTKLGER